MKIAEIFKSISGECNGLHQGVVTTFIRTQNCNLLCSYCDTKETQGDGGTVLNLDQILTQLDYLGCKVVCITGGEPLIQMKELVRLCKLLKHEGYKIIIETNGTISPIPLLPYTDSIVMDYKFEYEDKMDISRFLGLTEKDVIKFCIRDSEMYRAIHIQNLLLKSKCCAMFAYSPIIDWKTNPIDHTYFVNNLISMNNNSCIFSLQIHKFIGVR